MEPLSFVPAYFAFPAYFVFYAWSLEVPYYHNVKKSRLFHSIAFLLSRIVCNKSKIMFFFFDTFQGFFLSKVVYVRNASSKCFFSSFSVSEQRMKYVIWSLRQPALSDNLERKERKLLKCTSPRDWVISLELS